MERDRRHRISPVLRERARQLRRPLTPAEQKLYARLRDRQLGGFKFRRQANIDRFIADFYCAECGLVVELDGASHENQVEYDAERTEWLEQRGYYVFRVTNQDIHRHLESVLEALLAECQRRRR